MNRRIWFAASLGAALLGIGGAACGQDAPSYYVTGEGGVSILPNLQ